MASPFGTGAFGAAKPGGFGFGTPQPSQPAGGGGLFSSFTPGPAFGASSGAAFGSPAPGGFSFSSSPASTAAFGAASSTPATGGGFGFGAASSPSTGGAFGFGGSTGGGVGFGASTGGASSSSLFSSMSTPYMGGGATSTPFGACSSPGLFGSSPFGAASSGAAFSFSSPAGAVSSPFGVPGSAQSSPFGTATQMAPAAFSSSFGQDAATKEIGEVRAAYTPSSSTYKFQHLFLNVVREPSSRVKPPNVDEMRWRQVLAAAGGPSNPEGLWPVQAVGFRDLLARAAAQQQAITENQERLRALTELAAKMQRHHSGDLKTRTNDVQKRHIELSARLLHVTRLLDALEARLAASLGYRGDASTAKEGRLAHALNAVEAELAPGSSSGLQRRLEVVSAAAHMRGGGGAAAAAAAGGGSNKTRLDEKSLQQLFAVLREHAAGVRHLQDVLKRDQLDVQIMAQMAGVSQGPMGEALGLPTSPLCLF